MDDRAAELAARLPPLLVAAGRVAACAAAGIHGRRRPGPGETFWQYRAAMPGDPAGAIDWRRSARSQDLYVRENEWAAAQSVYVWRDGSASMDWRSDAALPPKRDRAELLALALAALLLRGGERVGVPGSGRPAAGGGANALPRLGRDLLAPSADWLAPMPRRAELVLFSDFLMPVEEVARRAEAIAAQGVTGHMVQVLDPAELTLPYAGRVRFAGLEGEGETVLRRAEDVRGEYCRRLRARGEALAQLARRQGWSFAMHRTDHGPQTALLALHARLSRGGRP